MPPQRPEFQEPTGSQLSPSSSGPRTPATSPGPGTRADGASNPAQGELGRIAPARLAALRALEAHAARFPDLLPFAEDEGDFADPRDAALAHAIVDAAVRRWTTLEYLVAPLLRKGLHPEGLEPALRAALLGAAAQLAFLDRVPAYAAIDQSVTYARAGAGPGAGALCNAVLRRMTSVIAPSRDAAPWNDRRDALPLADGGSRAIAGDLLPEDPLVRVAVASGLSGVVVQRWAATAGAEAARRAALQSIGPGPVVLNIAHARGVEGKNEGEPGGHAGNGGVAALSEALGVPLAAHAQRGHAVVTGGFAGLARALEARPDVWAQDVASSRAVLALREAAAHAGVDPARWRVVVDLCAGLGTKTRQLHAVFGAPGAGDGPRRLLASDPDETRARTLRAVAHRLPGCEVVEPARVERRVAELAGGHADGADAVLLDVPCSNSGVLSRRPEARHRLRRTEVERLASLQREILARGAGLLRPGGCLLYTTCSLEPEENGLQAAWAARHLGLTLVREGAHWPEGGPGSPPTRHADGSYHALLVRPSTPE